MSDPARVSEPLDNRLPNDHEIQSANQLRRILASRMESGGPVEFKVLDETNKPAEVILSRPLSELFIDLLKAVGGGDAVVVMPLSKQLTTQDAADLLNVSRPHLIKLLESGEMEFTSVGRHRRVLAKDVFAYKERRKLARDQALTRLAESDAELI